MSIEFDVKVVRPVPTRDLLTKITEYIAAFGLSGPADMDQAAEVCWGDVERDGVVRLGPAIASLLSHKAGEEADMGEEGGFWVTISAARCRTGAGVFLAAIVAAAIAEETGSAVTDEGGLLKLGRSVSPGEVLTHLGRFVGKGDLEAIGERLAASMGLAWPI